MRKFLLTLIVGCLVVAALSTVVAGAFRAPASISPREPNSGAKPCPAGSTHAKIGGSSLCLRVGQRCKKQYQAAYRKYGFSCVNGRLRKRSGGGGSPPPPPPAQAGHYRGLTSQNENFEFDVTPDGYGVRGLKTGQINAGCTPADFTLYGGNLNFGSNTLQIASDGSFRYDDTYQTSIDMYPATEHLTINGHLSGAVAIGNLRETTTWAYPGTTYTCESGLLTWTATRTG